MKIFTVIFSSIAIDDAEQAVDYYEEKQTGLGKRFAASYRVHLIVSNAILSLLLYAMMIYVVPPLRNFHTSYTIISMKKNCWSLSLQYTPLIKNHFGKTES